VQIQLSVFLVIFLRLLAAAANHPTIIISALGLVASSTDDPETRDVIMKSCAWCTALNMHLSLAAVCKLYSNKVIVMPPEILRFRFPCKLAATPNVFGCSYL
jgi:hypothetical protein